MQPDRHPRTTMPRPLPSLFAVLAAAGLLAACSGVPALERGDYAAAYRITELHHAARNEGVPVTVVGNPFGLSDEAATAETAGQLRVPGWGPQVAFRPRVAGDGGYGLVLAFDPPRRTTPQQVCQVQFGQPLERVPSEGETRVVAAFCNGGPLSSTRAGFAGASGPDDPRYGELLAQLALTLFPAVNPDMRDDGRGEPRVVP